MNEEGVIKFNIEWTKTDPIDGDLIRELNTWRNRMYKAGLIGVDKDGIGFGNMSIRYRKNQFIITGSGTGRLKKLTGKHYTVVTAYNLQMNTVKSRGPVMASSESLTHAILYGCSKDIGAVIHVHHHTLWKRLLKVLPSTSSDLEYGTIEIALEIKRLFQSGAFAGQKIFAMGGHLGGVIAFGKEPAEAGGVIFNWLGI